MTFSTIPEIEKHQLVYLYIYIYGSSHGRFMYRNCIVVTMQLMPPMIKITCIVSDSDGACIVSKNKAEIMIISLAVYAPFPSPAMSQVSSTFSVCKPQAELYIPPTCLLEAGPSSILLLKLFLSKCYAKFQLQGSYNSGSFMQVFTVHEQALISPIKRRFGLPRSPSRRHVGGM